MEERILVWDDIYLMQMTESDIPSLIAAINDKVVAAHTLTIPYPYTLNDAKTFFLLSQNRKQDAGYHLDWLIKKSDQVIGGIGLMCQDGFDSHRTEIGYWIDKQNRNRGLASMALQTLTQYIFENLHFIRIEAHTFCDNIPSQKVLEKTGFLREGLLRKYVKKDDQLKDVYCYSKLHPTFS
jgi:ribosomal-protein-alanine N-acetyltransferase